MHRYIVAYQSDQQTNPMRTIEVESQKDLTNIARALNSQEFILMEDPGPVGKVIMPAAIRSVEELPLRPSHCHSRPCCVCDCRG